MFFTIDETCPRVVQAVVTRQPACEAHALHPVRSLVGSDNGFLDRCMDILTRSIFHRHITRHLFHPLLIRMTCDSGQAYPPALQMMKKST